MTPGSSHVYQILHWGQVSSCNDATPKHRRKGVKRRCCPFRPKLVAGPEFLSKGTVSGRRAFRYERLHAVDQKAKRGRLITDRQADRQRASVVYIYITLSSSSLETSSFNQIRSPLPVDYVYNRPQPQQPNTRLHLIPLYETHQHHNRLSLPPKIIP